MFLKLTFNLPKCASVEDTRAAMDEIAKMAKSVGAEFFFGEIAEDPFGLVPSPEDEWDGSTIEETDPAS